MFLAYIILKNYMVHARMSIYIACCCSIAKSCLTLYDPMDCSTPGSLVRHYVPEFAQIHVHWVSDSTQPSHSLPPPSSFASVFLRIGVFSNESAFRIRWPKYWSFSFSISPSNKYSKLISFRIDWRIWSPCSPRDSWESSFQHHDSKASILHCSAFFMVQLSYPYMNTGKIIV